MVDLMLRTELPPRLLGLEVDKGCRNQGANRPVMHDQHSVLVEPASGKCKKLCAVGASQHFVAQQPNQGATLMLAHPSESETIAGDLLVIGVLVISVQFLTVRRASRHAGVRV